MPEPEPEYGPLAGSIANHGRVIPIGDTVHRRTSLWLTVHTDELLAARLEASR